MKLFDFRRNAAFRNSEKSSAPIYPAELSKKIEETLLEELEDILDKASEQEIDEAVINAYLFALDEKKPLEREFDVTYSWEALKASQPLLFQTADGVDNARKKKRGATTRLWPRLAAMVVVAIMVSMVYAQATGLDVFQAFAQWSKETFSFVFSGTLVGDSILEHKCDELKSNERMTFNNIQEALAYFNIPLSAPTWIPEGYEAGTATVNLISGSLNLMSNYMAADRAISIAYFEIQEGIAIDSEYEKDQRDVVEYEHNSTTYYIMHNLDSLNIAWVSNGFECSIGGPITMEDAQNIIDSIK